MRRLNASFVRPLLAGVAAIFGVSAPAQAGTLLATGLSPRLPDLGASCYVANVGTVAVRVNSVKFFQFDGAEVSQAPGNCHFPGNISPGLVCLALIPNGTASEEVRCVIDVATATGAKNIRGTMFLYNGSYDIVTGNPSQKIPMILDAH